MSRTVRLASSACQEKSPAGREPPHCQAAPKLVLEPVFEADFRSCSYGFRPARPGRSPSGSPADGACASPVSGSSAP
jgi:hypothetical protein